MVNKLTLPIFFFVLGYYLIPPKKDGFLSDVLGIFKDDILKAVQKYIPAFISFQIGLLILVRKW